MPEMFAFCGQRFQVYKRAHKTCDTVFPIRGRRVKDAVHLDTRCDGEAHGGCQAGCLLFWKTAWLKPVRAHAEETVSIGGTGAVGARPIEAQGCSELVVWANAEIPDQNGNGTRYVCQATRLPYATTALSWWDLRQYVEDYTSGNVGLWRIFCGMVYATFYSLSQAGIGLGRPLRWMYDKLHPVWRGTLFPRKTGPIPDGKPTPAAALNLQPGELVRIKPYEEILETLNVSGKNRGMSWDAEMVPYCGGTYRVHKRVTKIIDEKTGVMQEMKTPSIILDTVICQSRYSHCRMFCPRSIFSYWREIWLKESNPLIPAKARRRRRREANTRSGRGAVRSDIPPDETCRCFRN